MQPMLTDLLRGPWAVQPDRLPFICAALASAACRVAEPPATPCAARTGAATSAARRRQGDSSAIAVLPFYGVAVQRADALGEALGLLSLARFTQAFRAALADDAVSAILIDVDSPGGNVYGVAELADEIYRARARKPIAAIANSLAASGAYWVASAAREFYGIRPRIPAVANAADFAETQVPWGEWSLAARKCGDVVTVARMVRATADYRRGASRASQ